jgi:type II secretory pathway pseudopilin PulG
MILRSPRSARPPGAFTRLELVILLVVILVLALLAFPSLARAKAKANRIHCVSHLKNLGLGLRIFYTDNHAAGPWQVSTNKGGSKEFLNDPSLAWPHFLALSNSMSIPGIARCPADRDAVQPEAWADARTNSAISYFLGLDASEETPNLILSGDSNLELNGQRLRSTLVTLRTNADLRFDNSRHEQVTPGPGNILLGDGSVHQVTSAQLREAIFVPGYPNSSGRRLLIP